MRSSQSFATSVSLLSSSTSRSAARAMPRFTVPTKPRFCSLRSSSIRLSVAATSCSQALTSGSGLASSMTTSRQGVRQVLASTDSMQRRVSSSPRYTGTMTSTGSSPGVSGWAAVASVDGLRAEPTPSRRSTRILAWTMGRVARNTVEFSMSCTS